jgi:glycerophosphoryl diester phosphodiesterase
MSTPKIIAHRGASGHEYENSAAAFRRAVELGADGIELDVHATSDGTLVVHHDPALPGLGDIRNLKFSDLLRFRLPNGERLPTLPEALDVIGARDVWIEVKALDQRFDRALLDAIDDGPHPERYAVHSFDHRILRRLHGLRPSLPIGMLLTSYLLDPMAEMRRAGATALWQEWQMIDRELVDTVHAGKCRIIAWTVNTQAQLEGLTQLGVDGLCGNFPERGRAVVDRARR